MKPSDVASVPEQGQTVDAKLGSKPISTFISEDTKILADGSVKGTLHYVEGFIEFGKTQSEGHYMVVKLDEKYAEKTITCKGKVTKKAKDLEWVLFVVDNQSTFTFSTDEDGTILTLNFKDAVFEPKG